jgi:hypothetical protein
MVAMALQVIDSGVATIFVCFAEVLIFNIITSLLKFVKLIFPIIILQLHFTPDYLHNWK